MMGSDPMMYGVPSLVHTDSLPPVYNRPVHSYSPSVASMSSLVGAPVHPEVQPLMSNKSASDNANGNNNGNTNNNTSNSTNNINISMVLHEALQAASSAAPTVAPAADMAPVVKEPVQVCVSPCDEM